MRDPKPGASSLWEGINKDALQESNLDDLSTFKSDSVNFRLALFDPETNGRRYLLTLIHNLCSQLTDEDWHRLKQIRNRSVGSPICIEYNGEDVDLDYLQAVLEVGFISRHVAPDRLRILEVGAGYGRTCQALLSVYDVGAYYIVDLPNALKLAQKYLRSVLPDESFAKLTFVSTDDFQGVAKEHFDLVLNVDSFAEMDPHVVHLYLDFIATQADHFYVKNPVGKYRVEGPTPNDDSVQAALATGLLRDVVDIYRQDSVEAAVPKFVTAYSPAPGWDCLEHSWSPPWPYYWQAIYQRGDR